MKFRNIIFWMHLVCGVVIGSVILIMAVTGTILAYEKQIVAFFERDVRRVVQPQGEVRMDLDDVIAKVKEKYPNAKPSGMSVYADPQASIALNLGRADGTVYVNPYTGGILGKESKAHDFMHKVEVWHRWLGMEGNLKPIGHQVKGVCNLIFFGLVVTGFYLWWPKSWMWPGIQNIIFFNPRVQGKARDWNWHNVIGFWCAPLLIVTTLTGAIMSYQWANNILHRAAGSQPPAVKVPENKGTAQERFLELHEKKIKPINFDLIFVRAVDKESNWKSMNIRLPLKPDGPVTVMIQEQGSPYPSGRSQLTLDPETLEIKQWEPLSQQNRGRQWRVFARYLHTGEVYGLFGQTIAFIAALGATFLVWTGFAMAWNRFCVWRQRTRRG